MDNVRVEYYTSVNCQPCKIMKQPIEELMSAGWNIEKIDVDENRARTQAADVLAVPTFIVYRDNIPVRRFTGARQKATIESELKLAAGE